MATEQNEEEVRARLFRTGNAIGELQKELPELENRFEQFFKDALTMSNAVHSFLETNVEVSKHVLLPYTAEQKGRMKIMVEEAGKVATDVVALKTKLTDRNGASEKLSEYFLDCVKYISKTFPDAEKCYLQIDALNEIYVDYLKWYNEANAEIKELTSLMNVVNLKMKEFHN